MGGFLPPIALTCRSTWCLRIVIIIVQGIIMSMFIVKRVVWIKLGQGRLPLLSFLVRDALRFYVVVFRESF